MESALADVLIGRTLDRRYHVRSRIAHGGMATVYLATDTRLDRQVALKVMHAELARDADFVGRFIGEAKSVARLSHPNIVQVFDQGSDGQYLYLAMEYVPGRTLRSLLRERGWFTCGEALEIIDPILSGLAAAHRAGIVHRDVKPENVLLTPDGRVKVVDFGLARAQAASAPTRSGLIIGTVAYLAPEQVTGAVNDARTDVYAAGVMLWEMLTGRQPHTGDSPLEVAYKHVNSDVPGPAECVGGVPPAVDQLVRGATSRDPRVRPADASVFLRAVRTLRGVGVEDSDAITGAWGAAPQAGAGYGTAANAGGDGYAGYGGTGYGAGGGYAGAGGAGTPAGSHTMIVPDSLGYQTDASWGGAGHTRYSGGDGYGPREPFLQRWLFSRRLGFLVIAAAAVIGLGIGAWWLAAGRYTPLPTVTGMSETAAVQTLHAAGFAAREGSTVIDNNVPKGDVVSTSPSGRAVHGATIILTVSAGPRTITVPTVTGHSLQDAIGLLRQAGLMVSGTPKYVAVQGAALNSVAGTTPPSGTAWPVNQDVYVDLVGVSVPDLGGQAVGSIQSWAGQNDVHLNEVDIASNEPAGIIVRQSPAPGSAVQPGGNVTVYVSKGPPQVTIPNVRGEQFQQAQQQLQQLGFQVVGKKFGFANTVLFTSPSGSAPAGSTITVYYGGF